ncbi:MAG: hypothetical protein KGJ23_08760 [Euryarchaeota archaeon]|nr:hypothetical protein [Euryarchaeota archaeon]MDE1836694.1 hypothetical protein [Euryarchaeota archaeon]MDE1880277.1 hypothetical protein [Euryarchaeota archaeon]MDE2044664.1 hypothetical protein [Thermoplasmata archaeon]
MKRTRTYSVEGRLLRMCDGQDDPESIDLKVGRKTIDGLTIIRLLERAAGAPIPTREAERKRGLAKLHEKFPDQVARAGDDAYWAEVRKLPDEWDVVGEWDVEITVKVTRRDG